MAPLEVEENIEKFFKIGRNKENSTRSFLMVRY